jgi:hypothetical protein
MLHGWHGHNGVSLGNPRLGFVCTGQTVNGDPGLEGYYFEYDREIAPEERVRFAPDEHMPRFDSASAQKLDSASWPEERLRKVERSYAMEYVRSFLPVTQELFGVAEAERLVAKTARLIGLQFYEETAEMLGVAGDGAEDFARYLQALLSAQGENAAHDGAMVTQSAWKLLSGVAMPDDGAAFRAWNALWQGALAAHNRALRLDARFDGATIAWRIS